MTFVSRKLSFTLLIIIAGIIALDVSKHGSFKGSKTGVFLKDSGALHYGELAVTKFRTYSQQAYRWSQKHVPVYVAKGREIFGPYVLKIKEVLTTLLQHLWTNIKLVYQYFLEKKPMIIKWVNDYLPGVADSFWQAWTIVRRFSLQLVALLLEYLALVFQWLRQNVFIGKLSPENLQRYTMEAFNTTQTFAIQTLSWINNKVVDVSSST